MRTLYVLVLIVIFPLLTGGSPSGYVVGWGDNMAGQSTGVPFSGYSTGLVRSGSIVLSNAVAVAAGGSHGLALRADRTVVGWGYNLEGQATGLMSPYPYTTNGLVSKTGQSLKGVNAIAAAQNCSLALRTDGSLVGWGKIDAPTQASNVMSIALGWNHSLLLKQDTTVESWGAAGKPPIGLTNIIAIAATQANYGHDMALKRDGTVVEWSIRGVAREIQVPSKVSNVVAIAAGANYSLALKENGTVLGWGFNRSGEATGIPTTNSPFVTTGLVMVAGQILTNVTAIVSGNGFNLALKKDGTPVAWGHPPRRLMSVWTVPDGLTNVVAIAAGENFCLAITTNAAVAERFRR